MTPRLAEHLARLWPGCKIIAVEPLSPDPGDDKAIGYGEPARVRVLDADGGERTVVWHVGAANEFGHDRRADRASNALLAFDDFAKVPQHIAALDVGAITKTGELISLREWDELYVITSYAPGEIYADDLRRIAHDGVAAELDLARVDELASYLAHLHVPVQGAARYRRAIRDLVGHGEGIYGIVDGYPAGPFDDRLRAIEAQCATWRWRLRAHEDRLCRTHGDFHPFNLVFDGVRLACLDASRGACGEPADDVTALAVNFLVFALDARASWRHGLGVLWHRFWTGYLDERPDPDLLRVAPPFFAWRALVVCNPAFYPKLDDALRGELLDFAAAILEAGELDPRAADRLFA